MWICPTRADLVIPGGISICSLQGFLLSRTQAVKISWRGILILLRHSPLDYSQHYHCLLGIKSVPLEIKSRGGLLVLQQFSRSEMSFRLHRKTTTEPFFIHREWRDSDLFSVQNLRSSAKNIDTNCLGEGLWW